MAKKVPFVETVEELSISALNSTKASRPGAKVPPATGVTRP